MATRTTFSRILRSLLGTVLALILLLVAATLYLGLTASGNQFLANRIAGLVSNQDMQVSIQGASGLLHGRFHIDRITLSDTMGQFADVEDLDLSWKPSALLNWRFHAERVAAAKVALDRFPVKTLPSEASNSSFSLPIEVKVDSVDLPVIAIGKAIAQRDTTVAIRGSAQAVADRIALDLGAVEKDRLNASARAALAYAVNAGTLTLDAAISEPQGGLLAQALSLPGAPPVELAIKGDGPIANWKGAISGRIAGKDTVLLTGSHTMAEPGMHDVVLNGGGQISEFLPPALRTLFSGETKVDVDARFAETGLVDIRKGTVRNDSFALIANGKLDPKGEAMMAVSLTPVGDAIHLSLPADGGAIIADIARADMTLNGAFDAAILDMSATVAQLTTPDVKAAPIALTARSASLDLAKRTGLVSYDLSAATVELKNPDAAKFVQGPLRLKGEVNIAPDLITFSPSDLESANLGGKLSGSFIPSTHTAAANFDLFLLPRAVLPSDIAGKIEGMLDLSGDVKATLPATVSVQNLKLTSNLVTATGSASLLDGQIKASLAGDIVDLSAFAPKAAGKAHLTIEASGPIAKPAVAAKITSAEVKFAENSLENVGINLQSTIDAQRPTGKITASATYLGQVINAEADAAFEKGIVTIPSIKANIGANTATGALSLNSGFLPTGRIELDLADIGRLAALAGQKAEGALKATIDLASADGRIAGTIAASGPRLARDGVEISKPAVDIRIADLLTQDLTGTISASQIASGDNRLEQPKLVASVSGKQVEFDLASRFDDAPLTASGAILQQDDGLVVRLSSLAAAPRKIPLALREPTDIDVKGGTARIDGLTIQAGTGAIALTGTAGKTLDLKATMSALPISLANRVAANIDAGGTISGIVTVTGQASAPVISFNADILALALAQTRSAGLPPLDLAANGRFADQNLSLDISRDIKGQTDAEHRRVPLLKANATISDGQIAIPAFRLDLETNTIAGAVTLDKQFLPTGKVDINLPDAAALAALVGRKAEGAFKGTVDLASADGKINARVDATGTVRNQALAAIAQITVQNGAVSLPSLKANIGANTLSGAVTLNSDLLPAGQISFDFPDLALLASMAGQTAEGAVKGAVDITSTGQKIVADIAATGTIRGQAIDLKTKVTSENGVVSLPSLKANIGANTVTGALTLDSAFLPSGQFDFDLPDIGLLASLAGQEAEGALKGNATIRSTDGRIRSRISASGQTISSNGARIVNPLIDLTVADLAAGLISGRVAADEIVAGQSKVDKLTLTFGLVDNRTTFKLDGQLDEARLAAEGAIAQQGDALKLTLSSFTAAPRKIPVVLANATDILVKNGTAEIPGLTVNVGTGAVTVHGTAGKTLDLKATVASLPLTLANAFAPDLEAAGTLSANIAISGNSNAPVVEFDTDIRDIATSQTRNARLPALAIAANGTFANNLLTLDATSDIRDQKVRIDAETRLENGTVALPSFSAAIGANTVSGQLTLDRQFKPDGRVNFDITDANALAALVGQKAEGAIKGWADVKTADGTITAKVNATGLIREQAIKALAEITIGKDSISLPTLTLDVGKNRATGALTLDGQFMPTGKISFDLPDVALLAAMAGQTAEGSVKGTADVTSTAGKMEAKVVASGQIRGQAINLSAEAVRENQAIALPVLKLDVGKNTLSAALTLNPQFLPTGKATFDFPDIGLLAALAGQKAEGAIKGSADIANDNGKISGTLSARGTRLVSSGAEVINPVIDLKIADLTTGQISGKVAADRIASGANSVARLALDFSRAGNSTAFNLNSQYDGAPLTAKGAVEQQGDGIVLSLDAFSAAPKNVPVRLSKATSIRIADGAVSLSNLTMTAGRGSIVVTGGAGDKLDLTARITALPASLANAFSPGLDAGGTISANVTVKGDTANPVVAFDTNWQNAALAQTRAAGLQNFTITARGQLARNVLTINTNARSAGGLTLDAGGTVGITGNRALNLKVDGQLPFAALAAQTAASGIDLRGNARFNLTVTGNAASPAIAGQISTSGATLTVIRQNLTVKALTATVNLDGRQARITSLSGKIDGGGTVSVSGTVGIAANSGYPADIKIALKNAVYTDGKVVAAKLSGDLAITGSLVGTPVLKGTINLSRAGITIPQKLPGSLAQLDVRHKNASAAVIAQSRILKENTPGNVKANKGSGLALDLTISAPRQIFVRGRGLDAELGGKVMVTGTSSNPVVAGGFKMQRGRLSIIGRRLDFTTGEISFGGDMMPTLNMIASSTVESTTVNVTVSGLASNPSVSFSSAPALPQDEVLALLIFGRSSVNLSPVQIAQLADAVSTLAGGQSNSLFNRLRQGLGVDDLDVGTDENGKSNVSVGKYLNKRTYLQLQQGVDANTTSKAVINLDVGKGVKLRGEAGSDGSTAGGVFFEKQY